MELAGHGIRVVAPQHQARANTVKTVGGGRQRHYPALDSVAEYLAAEALFDQCSGQNTCIEQLLLGSSHAPGFNYALLQTVKARRTVGLEEQN